MENKELDVINEIRDYYGIKNVNIRYIQDKIIIDSLTNNVSIVLDSNYNIIDIVKKDVATERYIEGTLNYAKLSYPFDKYNISDLINIANNENVSMGVGLTKLSVRDELVSYMKFLNSLIEEYYDFSYRMQSIGYDMPSINNYTDSIINKISQIVISDLRLHVRPSTIEIMSGIGQKEDYVIYYNSIKNIINLYIDNMGLKKSADNTKEFEYLDDNDRENVSNIASNLLEEYKISDQEKVLK